MIKKGQAGVAFETQTRHRKWRIFAKNAAV
jgi:hypothetical protein